MAEPACPPGGGGAGGEGLGRSRSGFTTKLHLSADGRCRPLTLVTQGYFRCMPPTFRDSRAELTLDPTPCTHTTDPEPPNHPAAPDQRPGRPHRPALPSDTTRPRVHGT